jgi:hypothetical protein
MVEHWRLLRLDLAVGTAAEGQQQLAPVFRPTVAALFQWNHQSHFRQADKTLWVIFEEQQGKEGFSWWLWNPDSADSVVCLLGDSRSHRVPETICPTQAGSVLMVDH